MKALLAFILVIGAFTAYYADNTISGSTSNLALVFLILFRAFPYFLILAALFLMAYK